MNAVSTLLAGVMVEADDKRINFQVGDVGCTNLSVDGNRLRITDRPVVCALVCIRHLPDGLPVVLIEHRLHIVQRERIVLILCGIDGLSGVILTLDGSDRPAATGRRVERYRTIFAIAADGRRQCGIAAFSGDFAANLCRQDEAAEPHGRLIAAAVLGDLDFGSVTLCIALGCGDGIAATALDFDLYHPAVVCRGSICLAGGHSCRNGCSGCSGNGQCRRKVRQSQRVLAAHGVHVDGVIRGQPGQFGRDRPLAQPGQGHGIAAGAVRRASDGALAVGQGNGAASRYTDGQFGQRVAQHAVDGSLYVGHTDAHGVGVGSFLCRTAAGRTTGAGIKRPPCHSQTSFAAVAASMMWYCAVMAAPGTDDARSRRTPARLSVGANPAALATALLEGATLTATQSSAVRPLTLMSI